MSIGDVRLFCLLVVGDFSAAVPTWREVLARWDCAYVSGTDTTQAIGLPWAKGINVHHLDVWHHFIIIVIIIIIIIIIIIVITTTIIIIIICGSIIIFMNFCIVFLSTLGILDPEGYKRS